jgi:hypothetical protein
MRSMVPPFPIHLEIPNHKCGCIIITFLLHLQNTLTKTKKNKTLVMENFKFTPILVQFTPFLSP